MLAGAALFETNTEVMFAAACGVGRREDAVRAPGDPLDRHHVRCAIAGRPSSQRRTACSPAFPRPARLLGQAPRASAEATERPCYAGCAGSRRVGGDRHPLADDRWRRLTIELLSSLRPFLRRDHDRLLAVGTRRALVPPRPRKRLAHPKRHLAPGLQTSSI